MNKYIKINQNNEIIDVFFEHQKNKFDGSEILIGNVNPPYKRKINNKSISNDFGIYIFTWDGIQIFEKSQVEIDNETLPIYISKKIDLIKILILNQWINSSKNIAQIKEQYDLLKSQSLTWTTVAQVDTEIDNFIEWLDYE